MFLSAMQMRSNQLFGDDEKRGGTDVLGDFPRDAARAVVAQVVKTIDEDRYCIVDLPTGQHVWSRIKGVLYSLI